MKLYPGISRSFKNIANSELHQDESFIIIAPICVTMLTREYCNFLVVFFMRLTLQVLGRFFFSLTMRIMIIQQRVLLKLLRSIVVLLLDFCFELMSTEAFRVLLFPGKIAQLEPFKSFLSTFHEITPLFFKWYKISSTLLQKATNYSFSQR